MSKDQELTNILEEMFGKGAVHVEVIKVPKGSTLADEAAKRADPNWCEECGEVHDEQKAAPLPEATNKAVKAVRLHQARLLEALEVLKVLEKSLMTPSEKRSGKHALDELVMVMKLRSLGE